ncbi:hypothetical protein Csa_015474 [Cucumis sativus]|uniref:Uncharacterized protein n=1 Tax=Cucumis sativus TaxID=3659 RepID=A0A0A0LBB7_CUCSA|nr:hypothetical protein Csa_015474 [Cucumis sativus]
MAKDSKETFPSASADSPNSQISTKSETPKASYRSKNKSPSLRAKIIFIPSSPKQDSTKNLVIVAYDPVNTTILRQEEIPQTIVANSTNQKKKKKSFNPEVSKPGSFPRLHICPNFCICR